MITLFSRRKEQLRHGAGRVEQITHFFAGGYFIVAVVMLFNVNPPILIHWLIIGLLLFNKNICLGLGWMGRLEQRAYLVIGFCIQKMSLFYTIAAVCITTFDSFLQEHVWVKTILVFGFQQIRDGIFFFFF